MMTQRSIAAGPNPTVIVRAGGDVTVSGWDGERVQADSPGRWGLKVERRSQTEIARARAKVGERVLFDVRLDPGRKREPALAEAIEVSLGGSGTVRVPFGSALKVYSGKSLAVQDVQGSLAVYAGLDARTRGVRALSHASAGGALDLECETVDGAEVKFEAGRDLRLHVRNLADARLLVSDLGGEWEGLVGRGETVLRLRAGGDSTLVTDREVAAQPPDYVLGNIERPQEAEA